MARKGRSGLKPGFIGESSGGAANKASSNVLRERRSSSSLSFSQRQLESVPVSSSFVSARLNFA